MKETNNKLRKIHFVYLSILGIIIWGLSSIVLSSTIPNQIYWGEISNSLAFEIIGPLIVFVYIGLASFTNTSKVRKRARSIFIWIFIVAVFVFLIFKGILMWEHGGFWDITIQNFSLEIIGAVVMFYLLDKFVGLLDEQEQYIEAIETQQKNIQAEIEKERMLLELESQRSLAESYRYESDTWKGKYLIVQKELAELKDVRKRILGVLSDKSAQSRDQILSILNKSEDGFKIGMSEMSSVLGLLEEEKRIDTDSIGYYLLKKASAK